MRPVYLPFPALFLPKPKARPSGNQVTYYGRLVKPQSPVLRCFGRNDWIWTKQKPALSEEGMCSANNGAGKGVCVWVSGESTSLTFTFNLFITTEVYVIDMVAIKQVFSNCGPQTTSSKNLLEMQILRPCPRFPESLQMEPNHLYNKPSARF